MTTFRINRVYTRAGDDGDTGLVGGGRVSKTSCQVRSYGEVDELNSQLGVAREELPEGSEKLRKLIEYLQQELFDLGSELATSIGDAYPGMWKTGGSHVETLEKLCDRYGEDLPELQSFILPGGSRAAAALHVARAVCRRAERTVVDYRDELKSQGEALNPHLIEYMNRLSDLLFILARRVLADEGKTEVLWQPERERKLP